MKSTISRLEKLEDYYKDDPLIVLAELPNSEEVRKMTVEEMFSGGCGFVKVVSGSSMKDLEKILDDFRQKAHKQFSNKESKE